MAEFQIHIDMVTIGTLILTGQPAPSFRWHVGPMQQKEGASMPLEVTMTTEEQVRLTITPLTPAGDPAPIDGEAQWSVEGTATLQPLDATSTWVVAGAVGDSVVTVSADADMGTGTIHIMDTATIHVASPMASNLGLVAGEPELKA